MYYISTQWFGVETIDGHSWDELLEDREKTGILYGSA